MSCADLEIKYFYNKSSKKLNLDIKNHPKDFIVKEICQDGTICDETSIINIYKYLRSIDLLIFLFNGTEKEESEISDYVNSLNNNLTFLPLTVHNTSKQDDDTKSLLQTLQQQLKVSDQQFILNNSFLHLKKENYKDLVASPIKINDKILRSQIYNLLSYNPYLSVKTEDSSLIISKNKTDIFVCTLKKVMLNTVDACKMIERSIGASVSFAGNKDKYATTFQEVSVRCEFKELLKLAYINNECTPDDYINFIILNFIEGIDISDEEIIMAEESFDLCNTNKNLVTCDEQKISLVTNLIVNNNNTTRNNTNIESVDKQHTKIYHKSSISIFNIRKGHTKKLGDLKGNKFIIRIKNQNNLDVSGIKNGFINYYGLQRFGKRKNNQIIGKCILNKEYTEAVNLIIKNSKGYLDYENGNIEECLKKCDNIERFIFRNRNKMGDKQIVMKFRRDVRMIYLHAYQSYLFNESINKMFNKTGNWNEMEFFDLTKMNDKMLKGGTRRIIEKGSNVDGWNDGLDFIISFELNTSCYATMALREICKLN